MLGVEGEVSQYSFSSLHLHTGSSLLLQGPVEVAIEKDIHIDCAVVGKEGKASWLKFRAYHGHAHIKAQSEVYAHFDIPKGHVHIDGKSVVEGSVQAEHFHIHGQSILRCATRIVNSAPVAVAKHVELPEDTAISIVIEATDADSDELTYQIINTPAHGVLSGETPNLIYTPNAEYNGADQFIFIANDGQVDSEVAVVTLTVLPVNDAPVANDDQLQTNEDESVQLELTGSDVDSSELTFIVVEQPANGTLSGTAPNLTYTPNENFNGADSFTFKANDGELDSPVATVQIIVIPVNDAPVANDQSLSVDEDGALLITLTGSDVDGDTLTFTPAQPTNGTLVAQGLQWLYTPNINYHGADAISFTTADGHGGSDSAVVSITVISVNDAPVANAQSLSVDEDTSVIVSLTGSDVDGDILTFTPAQPSNGTLVVQGEQWLYTPHSDFNGPDSVSFTATDGNGGSSTAVVSITVNAVNDAPVANAQSLSVDEDTSVIVTLTGSDVDGDTVTLTPAQPSNGTLVAQGEQWLYTPNLNYNGSDSVSFTAADGNGGSSTAVVSITINAVNDAPVANSQSLSLDEDTSVLVTLTGSDVDGDTVTLTPAQPSNGTLVTQGAQWLYTPNADFNGADSINFTATDGNGGSTTAVVSITINAVNDAPVANAQSLSLDEDTSVLVTLGV